jgi:signal transduction histidine kinase
MIDRAVDEPGRADTAERPDILDHQGLWAALERQALEFIDTTELQRELTVHVTRGVAPPAGALGERWAICVFHIFQEMLSNVARHARARTVRIRLLVDSPPDPVLQLEVEDDGLGATPEQLAAPDRGGVRDMRERAGLYGGTVSIRSAPKRGMRVLLTMPLPVASGENR